MTPIYNAETLREVSTNARMAEYNRIKAEKIPTALLKINDNNFEAANDGKNTSNYQFNLLCMGLTTDEAQNYFRIALQEALKELGFKPILKNNNGMMIVTCNW